MKIGARVHNPAAFNYAEAFFNVAKRRGGLAALAAEAQAILQVCSHQRDKLARFMEGPQIPTENKLDLIDKAFGGKVDSLFVDLLKMLVERDRIVLTRDILAIFCDMVASEQGILRGRICTAVALSDSQQFNLRSALEKFTEKRLRIDYIVDAELLGGVVFQYKDQLIDGSIRGSFTKLKEQLEAVRVG